jgi:hypothetical protein
MVTVLEEVALERRQQDLKWGEQNWPMGGGTDYDRTASSVAHSNCDNAFSRGEGTWQDILQEEVAEVFAETDPLKIRAEAIQVAAVAIAIVECIDRKLGKK